MRRWRPNLADKCTSARLEGYFSEDCQGRQREKVGKNKHGNWKRKIGKPKPRARERKRERMCVEACVRVCLGACHKVVQNPLNKCVHFASTLAPHFSQWCKCTLASTIVWRLFFCASIFFLAFDGATLPAGTAPLEVKVHELIRVLAGALASVFVLLYQ